jgi:hypothetical protein
MPSKKWTDDVLEPMRHQVDPIADAVVADVIEHGGVEAFGEMMRHLVNNRDITPDKLPKRAREYFEQTASLPAWADPEKMKHGERLFDLYGPEMIMMLFFVSLPYAYATKKGSHVLAISAELTKRVHRRIFRTAQFIMDVMQPGGLGPNGRGIRSAQKVRLIHASIRYYITHKPDWRSQWQEGWGLPINQEDMAGTMLDFSTAVLRGLERARIKLTPEERECYLHCWKVVGHLIGVSEKLMPTDVNDAFDLAETIIGRNIGESDSGQALTKDLVRFVQGFLPRFMRGFPATAIRFLSGEQVANTVKCDRSDWTKILLRLQLALFGWFENFKRHHPRWQRLIRFLTWSVIDKVVLYEEGGEFYFNLPDRMREKWMMTKRG